MVFQGNEKIIPLKSETEMLSFENSKTTEFFEFIEIKLGTYHALMGRKGITAERKRK